METQFFRFLKIVGVGFKARAESDHAVRVLRVHQFAAAVRSCNLPEPYKNKGIRYVGDEFKKKQGTKSK